MELLAPDQEEKLSKLYPPFASLVREFVLEAHRQGMEVGIFEGLRTLERQRELYAKGRDANGKVVDQKAVVTNAVPGMSYHQYGLAVDLVFDRDAVKPGWQWSWGAEYPWKVLAGLGRQHGLEPGFFWVKFPEGPHYQKTFGFQPQELLRILTNGTLQDVWAAIDAREKMKS